MRHVTLVIVRSRRAAGRRRLSIHCDRFLVADAKAADTPIEGTEYCTSAPVGPALIRQLPQLPRRGRPSRQRTGS